MKNLVRLIRWKTALLFFFFPGLAGMCAAQKLAITFDDLPSNGALSPGVTQAETAKAVVAILKKRHVPPVYGFINAKKLEGNSDGAEALKLWAAAEPVGNHTYAHMDLEKNPAEAYEREIEEDEPTLELLQAKGDWRWLRYPYLHEGDTVEKRRAVRAYLKARGYRIAQVTLDWEDYLWNFAYARFLAMAEFRSESAAHMLPAPRRSSEKTEFRIPMAVNLTRFAPWPFLYARCCLRGAVL